MTPDTLNLKHDHMRRARFLLLLNTPYATQQISVSRPTSNDLGIDLISKILLNINDQPGLLAEWKEESGASRTMCDANPFCKSSFPCMRLSYCSMFQSYNVYCYNILSDNRQRFSCVSLCPWI